MEDITETQRQMQFRNYTHKPVWEVLLMPIGVICHDLRLAHSVVPPDEGQGEDRSPQSQIKCWRTGNELAIDSIVMVSIDFCHGTLNSLAWHVPGARGSAIGYPVLLGPNAVEPAIRFNAADNTHWLVAGNNHIREGIRLTMYKSRFYLASDTSTLAYNPLAIPGSEGIPDLVADISPTASSPASIAFPEVAGLADGDDNGGGAGAREPDQANFSGDDDADFGAGFTLGQFAGPGQQRVPDV